MMTYTFEFLYWLGVNPEKKTTAYWTQDARFQYAVAALGLIELLSNKNITWTTDKKLVVLPALPPEDLLLRQVWEMLSAKPRAIKTMLQNMVHGKVAFMRQVKARLIAQNCLKIEEKRFLGVIPYRNTHIVSDAERLAYQTRLQNIIQGDEKATLQDFILLKVANACKIQRIVDSLSKGQAQKDFIAKFADWATQKTAHDDVLAFLETLGLEKDLGELADMLDTLTDMVDSIGDAAADAGDGGGGDSSD